MPENRPSPSHTDHNAIVVCTLWCYGVLHDKGTEVTPPKMLSVLVSEHQKLKLPLDQKFLHQLPTALLGKIFDFTTEGEVKEPERDKKYFFQMPKFLAERKGFKING